MKKGFDFGFPDTKNEDSFSPYFTLNENGELFKWDFILVTRAF